MRGVQRQYLRFVEGIGAFGYPVTELALVSRLRPVGVYRLRGPAYCERIPNDVTVFPIELTGIALPFLFCRIFDRPMTRRYYVPDLLNQHPHVQLPDEEAAHAVKVMRLRVGDPVELFDGCGNQSAGQVVAVHRRNCECATEAPQAVNRETTQKLELALSLPKPELPKR